MEQSGMLLTLSVDTLSLVGSGYLWSVLRLTTGLYRGIADQELAVGTEQDAFARQLFGSDIK